LRDKRKGSGAVCFAKQYTFSKHLQPMFYSRHFCKYFFSLHLAQGNLGDFTFWASLRTLKTDQKA
jgi:hypothetical protein